MENEKKKRKMLSRYVNYIYIFYWYLHFVKYNFQVPEDEDEDDDVPYNPKNLPLGWDGKV